MPLVSTITVGRLPDSGLSLNDANVSRRHAVGTGHPKDAVLDLVPGGAQRDVRKTQTEQRRHERQRQQGPDPPGDLAQSADCRTVRLHLVVDQTIIAFANQR